MGRPSGLSCIGADSSQASAYMGRVTLPKVSAAPEPPKTQAKGVGPSTYLHSGAGKGWPHDHKAEDAFEVPPRTTVLPLDALEPLTAPEFPNALTEAQVEQAFIKSALAYAPTREEEYHSDGERLMLRVTTTTTELGLVATFNDAASAQQAAEALNNHKGY